MSLARVAPTPLAFGVAATAAVALALHPEGPAPLVDLLVASLLSSLALSLALALAALRGLRFERETPAVATRGDVVSVLHRLANGAGREVLGVSVEEADSLRAPARSFFPLVPALGRAEARAGVLAAERGRLVLGGVRLAAQDPLGLFRATRGDAARAEVLVRPRPRRLAAREVLSGLSGRKREALARGTSRARDACETASVREYRPGDPLRHVHWRLSARRGDLVVRTFSEPRARDAVIVLDRAPPGGPPAKARAAFERAVALAAGLGVEVLDAGGDLSLFGTGEPAFALEGLRGRAGSERLQDGLALVEPAERASGLPAFSARKGAIVVVVTARGPRPGLATAGAPGSPVVVVSVGGPGPASSSELSSGGAP